MKISIIIPNYNGKIQLQKNLPYIIKAGHDAEIIIVDDASTDGSSEYIIKKFPTIKLIQRTKNNGYASSINDGVQAATGDLVILLNHDVIPDHDFIRYLLPHFKDINTFAVGCLEKSREGNSTVLRGRGIGSFEKGFLVHKRGEINKYTTLWVSGGAAIFRKSIWERLGGLYTVYNPFYWEDIDISYRAQKTGYKIFFEPRSIIIHEHQHGAIRKYHSPKVIEVRSYKNQFIFIWLNITDKDLMLKHLLYLPYNILNAIKSRNLAFLQGFCLALIKIPTVAINRYKNIRLFKINDKKIIEAYAGEI